MAFSASRSAFEGFRLAKRSPMTIVIWAVFLIAYIVAFVAIAGAGMFNFIQTIAQMDQTVEPSPAEQMRLVGMMFGAMGLFIPLAWVFGAMMNGAVNRAIVRPEESAFGYLRLGMDEVRLVLTQIVLGICIMLVYFAVVLVFAAVLGGLMVAFGENNPGPAIAVGGLLYVALICFFIWIAVRFSLVYAITVAERRFAIFDSWSLTKGRFWSLLGCFILAFIMAWVVQMVASIVLIPLFFMGAASIGSQEAFDAMEWSEVFQRLAPYVIIGVIVLSLVYALQMAVMGTPMASAYKGIMEERKPSEPEADLPPAPPPTTPPTTPPVAPATPPVTPPTAAPPAS